MSRYETKDTYPVCAELILRVRGALPVNSVNAHDEGLNVRVGGAAELAAGLSAERGAVA